MRIQVQSKLIALAPGLVLSGVFVCARPARADRILALIDEHGHKVYVNTGERTKAPVDWATRSFRPLPPSPTDPAPADLNKLVNQAAIRLEIDPQLVHAIIQVESDYNPRAVSRKGALGLMQLIPATAERFGVENPFDPKQNLEGGINYLKYLLELFGGDLELSLAAYNAGEHSVMRRGGIPLFTETRDYVRKVTSRYNGGVEPRASGPQRQAPYKPQITRYVDAQGVVHYTNVE